jgi:hypothetical protein
MDSVGPENGELAVIVTAEIDAASAASARAGQRNLVQRSGAWSIFVFEHHNGLAGHRRAEAKPGEVNQFSGCRLGLRYQRLRLRIHSSIEADRMYLLK